jgi:hypothetical protein
MTEPDASDPRHPLTSMLKRKLALLHPEPDTIEGAKRPKVDDVGKELTPADREMIDGLKRFKDSGLGREISETCLTQ